MIITKLEVFRVMWRILLFRSGNKMGSTVKGLPEKRNFFTWPKAILV